jgi:hypothetical protein
MSQDEIAAVLARYRQSLSAFAGLTRGLSESAAAPGTPSAVRHRLEEAIEVFLPRLAKSLADLVCMAEELDYQMARVHRLRRRAKKLELRCIADLTPCPPLPSPSHPPGPPGEGEPMADMEEGVERLLREAEEKASGLEESSAALPEDRRAVHDSLAEVCRQLAERLRELKD